MGLALAGGTLLSLGGWLGGHLVYARGVGVDTTAFLPAASDWQDVASESELTEGTPHQVEVDGTAVVLIRQGQDIFALDDRCNHRGGPLHEGTVADGCVSCPWHNSVFRIADGSVVRRAGQPTPARWQVRRQEGTVQLRRPDEVGSLRSNVV